MNESPCPYIAEANQMCSVLVEEVIQADTWSRRQKVISAILIVRQKAKIMIAEWEHLHSRGDGCAKGLEGIEQ